jgi:hypothetical protein
MSMISHFDSGWDFTHITTKELPKKQQTYLELTIQHLTHKHYELGKDVEKNAEEMQKVRDIIDYLEKLN